MNHTVSDMDITQSWNSDPASTPEQWLDQHGDYLFRFALLRVQNESTAEDMVQETLLAALSARHQRAGLSSERTWLTGILKHKIIDHFRRSWREQPIDEDSAADFSSETDTDDYFLRDGHWDARPARWGNPAKDLEQHQFFDVLQRCMERLSPRIAQVFILKELHEMSTEEMCNELDSSATNIGVMLYRARMHLRQCLEYRWFEKEVR
jgi:RNA polymerase sigma-70 factor, ECF subfamily